MLELRHHPLTDMLALLGILRLVRRQRIQQGNPAPLAALVQRDEQLGQRRRVNDEEGGIGLDRSRGVFVLVVPLSVAGAIASWCRGCGISHAESGFVDVGDGCYGIGDDLC
jgi:hypothetical protein